MPRCYWDTRAASGQTIQTTAEIQNYFDFFAEESFEASPPQRPSTENNTFIMVRRILSVVQVRELGDGNRQRGLEHKAARDFALHHGCNPWGRNTELTCETAMPTSYREAGHGCNKGVVGTLSVINQLWRLDVIKIANVHLQLKLAGEVAGLRVQMCLF